MNTQAAVLLTVFVGLLAAISSQDIGQVYCGRRLSLALAAVCEDGLVKRSETAYVISEEQGFPWVPVHHARAMGRGKRQVVSECCYKPCSIDELQAYCAE